MKKDKTNSTACQRPGVGENVEGLQFTSSGWGTKAPGEAIAEAVAAFPDLSPNGFHASDRPPFDYDEVVTALEFLRGCQCRTKATQSSNLIRRLCEEWSGARRISVGAIIVAAHAYGYPIDPDRNDAGIGILTADMTRLTRMRDRARR
jgi:hypothetical protein